MFLNTRIFKKLIKKAGKGIGLTVGNDGEGLFFEGGTWILWVQNGYLPNKEKAAVIELCGELPEAGEVFKTIEKMGNQMEMERKDAWDVRANLTKAEERAYETELLMKDGEWRVLQKEDGRILLMDELLIAAVDNRFIEAEEKEADIISYLSGIALTEREEI